MQQQLLWWAESGKDLCPEKTEGWRCRGKTTSQRWHETWTPGIVAGRFGKMFQGLGETAPPETSNGY